MSKTPSKRTLLLSRIRTAGYHNDLAQGSRLLIENRISKGVYNDQWNKGRQQKENGMPCTCPQCKKDGKK